MNSQPSDALTGPRSPLRTIGVIGAGMLVAGGLGVGAFAVAQPFSGSEEETPAVEVTATQQPAEVPNVAPVAYYIATAIEGLTVTVDGSSSSDEDGEVVQWEWDFGDGTTSTGSTATHTFADYGTYTITLTVADDDGEETSWSAEIPVTAPPAEEPSGPAYGTYPPGYPMPRIPGTDQPDTSACASGAGTTTANGDQVCA